MLYDDMIYLCVCEIVLCQVAHFPYLIYTQVTLYHLYDLYMCKFNKALDLIQGLKLRGTQPKLKKELIPTVIIHQ